jgi:hypothetical protein
MPEIKHTKEFGDYLAKINEEGPHEDNKFRLGDGYYLVDKFLLFFKRNTTSRYQDINEVMEYLAYFSTFSEYHYPDIITKILKYSFDLPIGNTEYRLSKLSTYIVIKFCEQEVIEEYLRRAALNHHSDAFQIAIDSTRFDVVAYLLDKVKVTDEQYQQICKEAKSPHVEVILDKCMQQGLFPKEDTVYILLERGIEVDDTVLNMYKIVDDTNVRYVIARIKSGKVDFVKEKSKRFNFDSNDKEKIKDAIFKSLSHYIPKHLDYLSKMFGIKYDTGCYRVFCENSTDYKLFKYLLNQGVKPDYDSLCILVNRLGTASKIKKFFPKN